jgi:hypothetical protein
MLRANNAVHGDIMANVQPVSFSGTGRNLRVNGGLTPDLLSANSRNFGQAMNAAATGGTLNPASAVPTFGDSNAAGTRQAMLDSLKGSYDQFHPQFTGPTPLPQPGILDHILTGAGYAGAGLDLANQIRKQNGQ